MREDEVLYGDCNVVGIIHTFLDFKELNGRLYAIKNAICFVTSTQANFGLLFELIQKNVDTIRQMRVDQLMEDMEDKKVETSFF